MELMEIRTTPQMELMEMKTRTTPQMELMEISEDQNYTTDGADGDQRKWDPQTRVGKLLAGNLLVPSAAFFTGGSRSIFVETCHLPSLTHSVIHPAVVPPLALTPSWTLLPREPVLPLALTPSWTLLPPGDCSSFGSYTILNSASPRRLFFLWLLHHPGLCFPQGDCSSFGSYTILDSASPRRLFFLWLLHHPELCFPQETVLPLALTPSWTLLPRKTVLPLALTPYWTLLPPGDCSSFGSYTILNSASPRRLFFLWLLHHPGLCFPQETVLHLALTPSWTLLPPGDCSSFGSYTILDSASPRRLFFLWLSHHTGLCFPPDPPPGDCAGDVRNSYCLETEGLERCLQHIEDAVFKPWPLTDIRV
uniref:uncharacterized protein LOC124037359 n=1 Tax=Oncorhynchus gorbuscha TaxID=8017 RepID=UPI001EAF84AF|nr:uncharacterized protein LOC124037359 [Oncorhynchus gorbuscha]